MYNLEKTHYVLDEMVLNGCIVESNKTNVLEYIKDLDKTE